MPAADLAAIAEAGAARTVRQWTDHLLAFLSPANLANG
jgi:hypothetical protein